MVGPAALAETDPMPTPPPMKTIESNVADEAARAAGDVLKRFYRDGVSMRNKDVANLVSDADVEAERVVVATIRGHFPGHEVLGEEGHAGDTSAEHLWVVDPLDGTANFAHQIPVFAVSIAYYRSGVPECGVIFNPITDEWFTAIRGQGAFQGTRPARVSGRARLDEVVVGFGLPYDRGALMEATLAATAEFVRRETHGVRRMGSAALDLCMVGLGRFGVYFEYLLSPWDFAAGRLFVEEAGGRVTDCRGGAPPLARTGILASNGLLHEAALKILRAHDPGEIV
ncbi:MAG: inositol monophosphatase/fructose,6-bisphosphatase family protein [Planctomycetota bacterium]|nr:inositol monophosphatase/fructose,6-bisphosphatase family protein [Planctomycetota bacterium]